MIAPLNITHFMVEYFTVSITESNLVHRPSGSGCAG